MPQYLEVIDAVSGAMIVINHEENEKHDGNDFFVLYSVASLGALTTPDDTMTLTFKTPDSTKIGHFVFRATGTAGWRLRLIEAPSGGATSPTGTLDIYNSKRASTKTSTFKSIAGVAAKVSYDALLATGGKTLWDEYIAGSGGPLSGGSGAGHDEEILLKPNTTYQLSMYGTATDAGTLKIGWYEHIPKNI